MSVKLVKRRDIDDALLVSDLPDCSNWLQLLPRLHHVLAAPKDAIPFPDTPGPDFEEHGYAIQYWEAAWYMLTCLCGWSNAGRGLKWFYENGKDDCGDARLKLLKEIWDSQGQLSLLAAWLWKRAENEDLSRVMREEMSGGSNYPWTSPTVEVSLEWWRQFKADFQEQSFTFPAPYSFPDGSNELHMGHFFQIVTDSPSEGTLLQSDEDARTAVLVLDHFQGWYEQLVRQGKSLPSLGERSWHVDVFVRPVGWLGTFRQSRETGLWFQGKHSIHIIGQ